MPSINAPTAAATKAQSQSTELPHGQRRHQSQGNKQEDLGRFVSLKLAAVDNRRDRLYVRSMEVPFTPDTISQLRQAAASYGKSPEQLVRDITTSALRQRAAFLEGVARGKADIERGDLFEHDQVMRELDQLFQS